MTTAVVGVGTNLGAREAAVLGARGLLDARRGIQVVATSALYETEPLGPPQGKYLNAALRVETSLSPTALLGVLLRTERRLGRRRTVDMRWGPRSIDLDLLWDERGPHESPTLCVPHPELALRSFALAPLLDIAPELSSVYGDALVQAGGSPPRWERRALVRRDVSGRRTEVEVEADSLADACALAVAAAAPWGRPWSTRHAAIDPSPERFAGALRQVLRTGFEVHSATVSQCLQAQWIVQFHGINSGACNATNVRLRTTSGAERNTLACLSTGPAGA